MYSVLNSFKGLASTVSLALSLLCFGDVLLQVALGPLLPLLLLWAAHRILYWLLCTYSENVLRWQLCGVDVRSVVLRGVYPGFILLLMVWIVS